VTDTVEIVGCYMLALWGFGCMQYTTVSRISDIPFQIKPQTMICLLVLQRTIPDQVCKWLQELVQTLECRFSLAKTLSKQLQL